MAAPTSRSWIKKDFHVHESHSSDAPLATVEKYCSIAEKRGIDEICFTTHFILMGPDIQHGISPEKIPEYLEEIQRVQGKTNVKLYSGLEIDWFPEIERQIEAIIDEYPLDYTLGSMHYVRGIDIGSRRQSPAFFKNKVIEEALDIYFEEWAKAVESNLFDVMAHPDYFRKYLVKNPITQKYTPLFWHQYGTEVYKVFDSLRSYNVGIEVNSSGLKHGIRDVYPIVEFLKVAKENGIDTVTVGSDAHTVNDLGVNTIMCVEQLKKAGYKGLSIFEGRKNRKVDFSIIENISRE